MVRQLNSWLLELNYALRDRGCPTEVCHPLRHEYAAGSLDYTLYEALKEYEKDHGVPFGPIHQFLARSFAHNEAQHLLMFAATVLLGLIYVVRIWLHILFPRYYPTPYLL